VSRISGRVTAPIANIVYVNVHSYRDDPFHLKALVAAVWVLDTTHQALICHTAYTYLVTHFSQLAFLGQMVK
jgi:hypothetical protein